jgi:D-glycero-D-manno-heptose 1,7-bisphosphate phosphatase
MKAVFLDRDGVINHTVFRDGKVRAPHHVEDFHFFSGVAEAIALLKKAGYLTLVVTNQPDVARGWQTKFNVEAMNLKVKDELLVDDLLVCYHVDEDQCDCRKPKPGMLLAAAKKWSIHLETSYMIGDRAGDIAAGKNAGCATVLIGPGDEANIACDLHAENLLHAVQLILKAKNDFTNVHT